MPPDGPADRLPTCFVMLAQSSDEWIGPIFTSSPSKN
jgi:hypothetical protein